jgi:hypothetical protein
MRAMRVVRLVPPGTCAIGSVVLDLDAGDAGDAGNSGDAGNELNRELFSLRRFSQPSLTHQLTSPFKALTPAPAPTPTHQQSLLF